MAFPDCNRCDAERNSVVDFAWPSHCFELVFPKRQIVGETSRLHSLTLRAGLHRSFAPRSARPSDDRGVPMILPQRYFIFEFSFFCMKAATLS